MGRLNYSDVPALNVPTAGSTDSSTKVASTAFVQSVVPAGVVFPYAGSVAPANFLMCDGSTVSRTTYAALFAAIGTTYGAGDGSTTFKLPDLRGQFIRGLDQGAGIDSGRTLGSSQADSIIAHTHTIPATQSSTANNTAYRLNATDGSGAGLTSSTGGTETRPKNVALNHIIKAY